MRTLKNPVKKQKTLKNHQGNFQEENIKETKTPRKRRAGMSRVPPVAFRPTGRNWLLRRGSWSFCFSWQLPGSTPRSLTAALYSSKIDKGWVPKSYPLRRLHSNCTSETWETGGILFREYCFGGENSLNSEFCGKLGEFCEKLGEFAFAHK